MKIIRYSLKGFEPQYQSHHLKKVLHHLKDFNIKTYPEHLQFFIQKHHNKVLPLYQKNFQDFRYGVWTFIEGHKNNQSLNHLTRKVPCWEAEISDDTIVYDVGWTKQMKITDEECTYFGFYIPKSQLKTLKSIHKKQ